jgi:hypothetical protein
MAKKLSRFCIAIDCKFPEKMDIAEPNPQKSTT